MQYLAINWGEMGQLTHQLHPIKIYQQFITIDIHGLISASRNRAQTKVTFILQTTIDLSFNSQTNIKKIKYSLHLNIILQYLPLFYINSTKLHRKILISHTYFVSDIRISPKIYKDTNQSMLVFCLASEEDLRGIRTSGSIIWNNILINLKQRQMTQALDSFPFGKQCLICGNAVCEEAYDHLKITLEQLNSILNLHKYEDTERNALINQVEEFYECLTSEIINSIQRDRQHVLQMLKKSDYSFLKSNRKVSLELVSQIVCNNFQSLPSKRLVPIIQAFKNTKNKSSVQQRQIQLQNTIRQYISVENFMKKRSEFKESLLSPILNLTNQVKFQRNRKVSVRENENPQELIPADDNIQINIKGRIITEKSIQAEINNRNVNDNDIVSSINQLKKLKSLTKVEARNNRITNLTCKLFAFNLPFLTKLDIRGNNLGDEGIVVLARNMRSIRQFYICQNKVTDVSVNEIYHNMKEIRMLWMQNNQISLNAATMIMNLQNLRAIALHGNLFSEDEGQCLKINFLGYINI